MLPAVALLFSALPPMRIDLSMITTVSATISAAATPMPGDATNDWIRILTLQSYNLRLVAIGTMLLGFAAGTVGSLALLRRRALMGDALAHATWPGIVGAYAISNWLGGTGRSLAMLLAGGTASGLLGMGTILVIRRTTRLKEDAALGIVLSVYFGIGAALFGVVNQIGKPAGLESFIFGSAASMIASDTYLIAGAGVLAVLLSIAFRKEFRLLCFDDAFAGARGFPVGILDSLLMGLIVLVTITGLQAVGLVLMIALLVIPAAAARFWTISTNQMMLISGGIGALSCFLGSILSAMIADLPSGASIVLIAAACFSISMLAGRTGIVPRYLRRYRLALDVDRQHLLRGVYERLELKQRLTPKRDGGSESVRFDFLLATRSWSARRLNSAIRRAAADELVSQANDGAIRLTALGLARAEKLTHDHRLWELYLITHAEIAPGQVDRGADRIEHVLDAAMIQRLEQMLDSVDNPRSVPGSPHPMDSHHDLENGLGGAT